MNQTIEEILKNKKVLILPIKKQWFDLIKQRVKREEYREIKPYYDSRLLDKENKEEFRHYDYVLFKNGYASNSPTLLVELKGIRMGAGKPSWGAKLNKVYYVLELGKIVG